jgi:hypothetical protein
MPTINNMYTLTVICKWLAAAYFLLHSCLCMIAKKVKTFGPTPAGHTSTSDRQQIQGPTFLFLQTYNSKPLYELFTSCTYFVEAPCGFTNSLLLNKCVFSKTIYQSTFCTLVQYRSVHIIYMATACHNTVITINIIIDVKLHAKLRDTGDVGYWRYRYTHS